MVACTRMFLQKNKQPKKNCLKPISFVLNFFLKLMQSPEQMVKKKRGYHVSTLMPFWLKPIIKVVINNDALNDSMYSLKITCSPSTPGIPGDPGSPC